MENQKVEYVVREIDHLLEGDEDFYISTGEYIREMVEGYLQDEDKELDDFIEFVGTTYEELEDSQYYGQLMNLGAGMDYIYSLDTLYRHFDEIKGALPRKKHEKFRDLLSQLSE